MSWIDRGSAAIVLGIPTRVLAAEELIASKLFVDFRERFDGADVVHIIYGTQGRLDWTRLQQLVGEHWELLLWALVLFHYVYPMASNLVPRPVLDDSADEVPPRIGFAIASCRLSRQPHRREDVCHRRTGVGHGEPAAGTTCAAGAEDHGKLPAPESVDRRNDNRA